MRVVVVGGGLVGLATAHHLERRGVDVTVLEAGPRVGGGASRGNAGWICPTQVAPLAAPGLIRRLTRDALSPASALYIRPRGLLPLAPFLLKLAAGAKRKTYDARVAAMRGLAEMAWPAIDEIEVGVRQSGILSVFSSEAAARHALDLLGVDVALIDAFEACVSAKATTGFVLPDDGFVDPGELVDALAASVSGRVLVGTDVRAITRVGRGWTVTLDGETLAAEAVVLAAGAHTPELAKLAGHHLRVVPGKGYSFTVPMDAPPARPLHLEEAHCVLTPLPGGVRVAGTMEFGDRTNRLDPRRVEAIAKAAAPWVDGVDWEARSDVWVGERPITADGLPMIGPLDNGLFVATGHGMYGVTLALPTGDVLARAITGANDRINLETFDPLR
jgi:D-amino-acid dehydrogenase